MYRRDVLGAAGGLLGGALAASDRSGAAAHPTPTGGNASVAAGTAASDGQSGFAPLGSLAVPGAREAVVADDGSTVFLAVGDGFAVVDVSEPSDPRLVVERHDVLADASGGPLSGIQEVAVDGDRLLVVGPAHPDETALKAALLYDVSDPSAPRRLAVHRTDYPIHNAGLRAGRAYLTANDGGDNALEVVAMVDDGEGVEEIEGDGEGGGGDGSTTSGDGKAAGGKAAKGEGDGANPSVLGRWSLADADGDWAGVPSAIVPLHDVFVRGDVAYCSYWDAGTWLLDVSDPSAPRALGRVGGRSAAELADVEERGTESSELPGNHHSAAVDESGTLLAVGHEAWDADGDRLGAPGGIDLVDVGDPGAPERLATVPPPPTPDSSYQGVWTTAHNFDLRDGFLYSAWYQGGVQVHDVSNPEAPREVAAWRDSTSTRFWTAQRAWSTLVASSMGTGAGEAGLYTFPLPGERTQSTATGDPTAGAPTTNSPTTSTASTAATTTSPDAVTATPGLAGFGAAATALGGCLAWLLARRRRG